LFFDVLYIATSNKPTTRVFDIKDFAQNTVPSKLNMPVVPLAIPYTPEYVEQLRTLVHEKEVLASAGYVTAQLSDEALELKKRCYGCGKGILIFVFLSS
jgi:hypothetical protein